MVPLAQAMLAYGVTISSATETLKKALLDAALTSSDDNMTDSSASLLTGIHRKDVKRLRQANPPQPARRSSSAPAIVISYWATDPEFQNPSGAPRDLPRRSDGSAPSFETLTRKARVDMASGTVMRALLDQGIISEQADGTLRLVVQAFVATAGEQERLSAYQATLSAHLIAATHNLLSEPGDPHRFDRALRYSHLSEESVQALEAVAAERAQALLQEINALARELQERDQERKQNGRFVMGTFILPTPPKEKD